MPRDPQNLSKPITPIAVSARVRKRDHFLIIFMKNQDFDPKVVGFMKNHFLEQKSPLGALAAAGTVKTLCRS